MAFWHKERKKSYAEVAKIYSKNESSIRNIVKEKEIRANFAVAPQTAKVTAIVHDNCLVKMEKELNLYNKVLWERERPHSHNFYYSILL